MAGVERREELIEAIVTGLAPKLFPVGPGSVKFIVRDVLETRDQVLSTAESSRPAELTTSEEVAALPDGSVILDKQGDVWQRRLDSWCGYEVALQPINGFRKTWLPATILHIPTPAPEGETK
jgi:hypothetical protein